MQSCDIHVDKVSYKAQKYNMYSDFARKIVNNWQFAYYSKSTKVHLFLHIYFLTSPLK